MAKTEQMQTWRGLGRGSGCRCAGRPWARPGLGVCPAVQSRTLSPSPSPGSFLLTVY